MGSFIQGVKLHVAEESDDPNSLSVQAMLDVIYLCSSTDTLLLPQLRTLEGTLVGGQACRTLASIISPRTTSVRLHLESVDSVLALEGVLQRIALSTRINILHLKGLSSLHAIHNPVFPALHRTLRSLNHLEEIGLESKCFFDVGIWDLLGSLPQLRVIKVLDLGLLPRNQLSVAALQFDANKFPCLEHLEVEGPGETLINLFESGMPSHIHDLGLCVANRPYWVHQVDAARLLQAMTRTNHRTMQNFSIRFESGTYRVRSSLLNSIVAWKNLTMLEIRTEGRAELTDEDFGKFVVAMPNLRSLEISFDPVNFLQAPAATFGALSKIARGCPDMQSLGLFINTNPHFIPDYAEGEPVFNQINKINFGLSLVDNVLSCVLFIGRICGPSAVSIYYGQSVTPPHWSISPGHQTRINELCDDWEEVDEGVKKLQAFTRPLHQTVIDLRQGADKHSDATGEEGVVQG